MAYKREFKEAPVHQYITNESLKIGSLLPLEIKNHASNSIYKEIEEFSVSLVGYETGKDLITGSGEEDTPIMEAFSHFWNPDNPNTLLTPGNDDYNDGIDVSGFVNQQSNYRKALAYWRTYVLPLYLQGKEDEAYYWFGRVAHLLEDATVTDHTQNDCHLAWFYSLGLQLPFGACENSYPEGGLPYDDSSLEEYTGENYSDYTGSDYSGQQYDYESLPNTDTLNWNEITPTGISGAGEQELFKLFWYTAQKTQYFASDDVNGNSQYRKIGSSTLYDLPNLWSGDSVTIINKSADLAYEDTHENSGANITAVSNAMIPHAMKATAGLYRLFWDAVNIDWPFYHHDVRRTGFTLLKGDIEAGEEEEVSFTLEENMNASYVDLPSIADIDEDGKMELVTVSKLGTNPQTDDSNIFIMEYNGVPLGFVALDNSSYMIFIDNGKAAALLFNESMGGKENEN